MEMCLILYLITSPSFYKRVMFARQARWEVLAATLGETRKNMTRPIERGRHWFLMRGCMSEEQGLGGSLSMKEEVRYKGDDMSCTEKGNALTSERAIE